MNSEQAEKAFNIQDCAKVSLEDNFKYPDIQIDIGLT